MRSFMRSLFISIGGREWGISASLCRALLVLALGDESGGFQLVYTGHFLLAWEVIFDKRIDRSVVCIFFIF